MEQNKYFNIFEDLDIKNIDSSLVERVNKLSEILYTMIKKRIDSNLSQRDLAQLSNIKQPMIARIEKMTTIPRLDTFISLVDALGLDIKLIDKEIVKHEDLEKKHVMKYIESKIDLSPKFSQNLSYYIQMFYLFQKKNYQYKEYGYHIIEESEEENMVLDPKLKEVVDAVIKYFGIYSADTLEYFIRQEDPYIKALNRESKIIEKSDIKEYGEKIIKEYNINSPKEIYKYSEAMFKKFLLENK